MGQGEVFLGSLHPNSDQTCRSTPLARWDEVTAQEAEVTAERICNEKKKDIFTDLLVCPGCRRRFDAGHPDLELSGCLF